MENLAEKILNSISDLPPFPVVIQRALQLIDDPKTSAQDVVDVIQYDQSITANVLKLCNSAYFGLRRKVHSLREALVMIGFNPLMEIIMSRESVSLFSGSCKGYDLEQGDLWRHSVACALLSRIIAKRINREANPTHFTAALLHDIGKMILSRFVSDSFKEIQCLTKEGRLSFIEAEREVLGMDHAQLGGKIVAQWKFPEIIISAVRYHHTPLSATENQEIVQLIYLCDLVSMLTGLGGGADGLSYHACEEVMKRFQLEEEDIERFIVQLGTNFHLVKEMLNIKEG